MLLAIVMNWWRKIPFPKYFSENGEFSPKKIQWAAATAAAARLLLDEEGRSDGWIHGCNIEFKMSNLVSKATFSKATDAKRNSSVSFCLRSAAVPSERGEGKCTSEDDGERRWRWMSGSSSSSSNHGAVELWWLDTMRASKEKTVVGGAWGRGGAAAAAPRPQENRCVFRGIITLIIVIFCCCCCLWLCHKKKTKK